MEPSPYENFQEFLDDSEDPEKLHEKQEQIEALYAAIAGLNKADRQLVQALFFDGQSEREYADHNEQLDKLKELQGILDEYEPTKAFDEDLFHQIIEKAVVMSKSEIAFHLIGGLKLTETIA